MGNMILKLLNIAKTLVFKKTFNSELKTFDTIDNLYLFPRICVYRYDTVKILLNKVVGKFDFLNINPND